MASTKGQHAPKRVGNPDIETVVGQQAAYESMLGDAMALAHPQIEPAIGEPDVVVANVKKIVRSLRAKESVIKRELTAMDFDELAKLESIADGFRFAVGMVGGADRPDLVAAIKNARELRKKMMVALEALASAGLVPKARYDAIKAGTGALDAAQDLIDGAKLYLDFRAAIEGKTTLTPQFMTECATTGTALRDALRPKNAPKVTPEARKTALEIRDRFYTLITMRWPDVWRVCAYCYGPSVIGEYAPPLHSRIGRSRKAASEAEPATPPAEPTVAVPVGAATAVANAVKGHDAAQS